VGHRAGQGSVLPATPEPRSREGPRAIEDAAGRLGYDPRDLSDLDEWLHTGWWPRVPPRRPGRFPYRDPTTLLQALADMQLPELLGARTEIDRAAYRNPLEVVLGGSGLLIAGVISILRLVRDWSNTRRRGAADAQRAEASAREQDARADECEARAELVRWLVDEAKAGRIPIPVGELLDLVTNSEETALERLASGTVELELPPGIDPS
jgi:hypothetical protein